MSGDRAARAGLALLIAAFLILGLRAIGSASPTTDEPGHYRYGHRILRGVAERWDDSKMPISALNALPCYVAERVGSGARDVDEFAGPCDWTLARLPSLMGGLALGLAIASWSKALFGWPGALVSTALFAFDPNLIAHSSLVTTDIFGALFLLLALRAFTHWMEAPGLRQAGLLGLATGAAFIAKYTAAYLLLIFLIAALWARKSKAENPATPRSGPGRIVSLGVAALIALAVINTGFLGDETGGSLLDQKFESPQFRELRKIPGIAKLPLPVPRPFIEGLDRVFHRERNGGGSGNIYFMGELRNPGERGFAAYFLVLGFVKTPIPALLLVGLAAITLMRGRGRSLTTDERVLLVAVVFFTGYFSLLFRAQIGLRHFLVVFPPIYVLAGALGPRLAATQARTIAAMAGVLLSALSVVRHGDDPLSYFNELVAPTKTYRIAADSNLEWGQSKARVDAWVAAHPGVLLAPAKPFPGRILVSANQLTGVVTRKRMEWLRASGLEPTEHVAFTHFVFEVTPEMAGRLRRERGDPPLQDE